MSQMTGDEKHGPAATSTLDVLWVLYDRVLRVDPARPEDPGRDRFLLSKGHGPMAYYAVLAAKGFIPHVNGRLGRRIQACILDGHRRVASNIFRQNQIIRPVLSLLRHKGEGTKDFLASRQRYDHGRLHIQAPQ